MEEEDEEEEKKKKKKKKKKWRWTRGKKRNLKKVPRACRNVLCMRSKRARARVHQNMQDNACHLIHVKRARRLPTAVRCFVVAVGARPGDQIASRFVHRLFFFTPGFGFFVHPPSFLLFLASLPRLVGLRRANLAVYEFDNSAATRSRKVRKACYRFVASKSAPVHTMR
ncbi:hypothetical protein KM043_012504 [Ampulex compressa]|nr:hypothetical protein KM043_012504 [Ampulex compressa]